MNKLNPVVVYLSNGQAFFVSIIHDDVDLMTLNQQGASTSHNQPLDTAK